MKQSCQNAEVFWKQQKELHERFKLKSKGKPNASTVERNLSRYIGGKLNGHGHVCNRQSSQHLGF